MLRLPDQFARVLAVRKSSLDKRWPWFLAAAVLILMLLSTFVRVRVGGDWDDRPAGGVEAIERLKERGDLNVLFLVVDTLRAERLGSYGYERETSPFLDRLASSGVRFERHLAQSSWTKSSMASMWTGLYPANSGITRYDSVIPEAAQMPAELLRDAGFQTIGLWRNGWVDPTFGFGQGFDLYHKPLGKEMPKEVKRKNPSLTEKGTDEALVEVALEFVRINGETPWFLYVHLMDLHEYIFDDESALFGGDHTDHYDNSILWTDRTIELLLEHLADLGHLDKTLVVIGSDHGEAFLERGHEGHARWVYRETTEVPLLISFPFRLDPGLVVRSRTRNVDIWPTVFDLLGIEGPTGIDGRSQLPAILAAATGVEADGQEQTAIADLDRNWAQRGSMKLPTIAVVDGPHRYVRVHREDESQGEELFDTRADPREKRDRSMEDPETLERLRAVADAYAESEPTWGEPPTRELSELQLNLLRALGYKIE
jgi:arylsulfatase A-like enzyme